MMLPRWRLKFQGKSHGTSCTWLPTLRGQVDGGLAGSAAGAPRETAGTQQPLRPSGGGRSAVRGARQRRLPWFPGVTWARGGAAGAGRGGPGGEEGRPRREREEPEMLPVLLGPRSLSRRRRTEQPGAGSRGPGQPGGWGQVLRARNR